jgi:hypothetical protein
LTPNESEIIQHPIISCSPGGHSGKIPVIKLNFMVDLKTYENILVSGVKYDFSQRWHANIPARLLSD